MRPTFARRRCKGGFLSHLLPFNTSTAICGFKPSSPRTYRMRQRHGWSTVEGHRLCKKCAAKANVLTPEK